MAAFLDQVVKAEQWKANCPLANMYYSFLENTYALTGNSNLTTIQRVAALMPCKSDCDIQALLSPNPIFSNTISFIGLMSALMSPAASTQCPYTLSAFLDFNYVQPFNSEAIINPLSKWARKCRQISLSFQLPHLLLVGIRSVLVDSIFRPDRLIQLSCEK